MGCQRVRTNQPLPSITPPYLFQVPTCFAGIHTVRACVASVPRWLLVSMDLACELNLFVPPVLVYIFHGQRVRALFVEERQRETIPLVAGPPRKSFIGMTDL